MADVIEVAGMHLSHGEALAALRFRGSLPGAYAFDRNADLFRRLQAGGQSATSLLPAAFPASWLVNASATSRTFAAWLREHEESWGSLASLLSFERSIYEIDDLARDEIEDAMKRLLDATGATVGSITKVLALLRPQLVPIAHDAVVFGLRGDEAPKDADAENCDVASFFFLLQKFNALVVENKPALISLARDYELAPLDAPQVMDRLLWWRFWGRRYDPDAR